LEDTGDFKRDVCANMEKVVAGLERVIRQHPEQWLIFYRPWPDDASPSWYDLGRGTGFGALEESDGKG